MAARPRPPRRCGARRPDGREPARRERSPTRCSSQPRRTRSTCGWPVSSACRAPCRCRSSPRTGCSECSPSSPPSPVATTAPRTSPSPKISRDVPPSPSTTPTSTRRPGVSRRCSSPPCCRRTFPSSPGWQIGTVYRQAGRTDVGGDYYDVSGLDDGRVIAVLGDVMGRGVDAAVSGSLMRSAARVLSTQDPEPAALARAMDRFMVVEPPTQMASAVYVLFDPAEDDLALVVAGHPPPLLFRDGRSRFVTEDGSPIHGLGEVPASRRTLPFGAGDLLLLYTDGLVERRGESIDIGLERLQAAADELFTAVDDDDRPRRRAGQAHRVGVRPGPSGRRRRARLPSTRVSRPLALPGESARGRGRSGRHTPLCWCADESARRSRQGLGPAEERPGSTGQGGGQQPPGVTRGTVPQRTDRRRLRQPVRVKRWCKRPPALQVTGAAR